METRAGTYCVYAHINMINGKMYIGQTIHGNNPNKRWSNGNGYKHCPHFWSAICKYGWENFEHEIIASRLTSEEAGTFEELLISTLDTTNNDKGYNVLPGGDSKILPEEVKAKIGDAARERLKDKHNHPFYGKHGSLAAFYGKHHTSESRKKISESQKEKYISKETREKNRAAAIKRFSSQEERDRIGAKSLGRKHSEEDRKKMRENSTCKKTVYSPELNMRFDSVTEASEYVHIPVSNICRVCHGKRKHAGKHPVTGELLTWNEIIEEVRSDDHTGTN